MGAAGEGFAFGADGQTLPPAAPERLLSTLLARPLAEFQPVRPVQVGFQDIRGIEISERFSIVEVPEEIADYVIESVNGTRIRGRKVAVRRDRRED